MKTYLTYFKNDYFIKPALFLITVLALITYQYRQLANQTSTNAPRLAVVIVIDQFAYHYLPRLRPYFKAGLKKLFNEGVLYHNCVYPHGLPCTATGHAALSSGAYGKDHGIISNQWVNENGSIINAGFDDAETSYVFAPNGSTYDYGVSANAMLVDNFSDQFLLAEQPGTKHFCAAFSFKDRAAALMAGKKGSAFWFDAKGGQMTSSRAYFDALPEWLTLFNQTHKLSEDTIIHWESTFPANSPAYNFSMSQDYTFTTYGKQFMGTSFPAGKTFNNFKMSPDCDKLTLETAKEYLKHTACPNSTTMLWISLSALDFCGHMFGPNTVESADILYHIDQCLLEFMNYVETLAPATNITWALTADHGVMPIPEVLNAKGFAQAQRIDSKEHLKAMNELVYSQFGIKNLIKLYQTPQFYFDKPLFRSLPYEAQQAITAMLTDYLKAIPGIVDVWSMEELLSNIPHWSEFTQLFQNQTQKDRSGELTCLFSPYTLLTEYDKGTSHATPYLYDRHVPMVIHQQDLTTNKNISAPTSPLQLVRTLAYLLGVQAPSASVRDPLPEIFDPLS